MGIRDRLSQLRQWLAIQLSFDGLDVAEIAADIEQSWPISFDDMHHSNLVTVQDVAQEIARLAHIPLDAVMPRLIAILADRLSRDPVGITPTTRLIEDLGFD